MLGTGITLVLALVLFLWPVQIMDLLSNKHELSVLGAPYLKLIGFSYVFNMLSSIYVSAMRCAEAASRESVPLISVRLAAASGSSIPLKVASISVGVRPRRGAMRRSASSR